MTEPDPDAEPDRDAGRDPVISGLGELGALMLDAGYPSTDVEATLDTAAAVAGRPEMAF